jgi:hypothetical protein
MHVQPQRHRHSLAIRVALIAALLGVCFGGFTAIAGAKTKPKVKPKVNVQLATSLPGKWSGQYSGAVSGTFTLHWTLSGSTLRGSITLSSPGGTYGINGKVSGSAISFGAVGAGATYTGSVSGSSMSGTWKSPIGSGSWSADKG